MTHTPDLTPMRSRSAARRASFLSIPFVALGLASVPFTAVDAADGTWINNGSSNWSTTSNWTGGVAASGTDATANFNTVDLTADRTVTFDSSDPTLGYLVFGDTVTSTAGSWKLSGGTLTLATTTGTPTITVNSMVSSKNAQIDSAISGSQGLIKEGTGKLILSGVHTGLTGTFTVNAGTLDLWSTSAYTNNINLTASSATLDAGNTGNGTTIIIDGNITGSGKINKTSGVSTLVLNGNNTFTGGTTLGSGTLVLGNGTNNGIGTGTFTLSGGTLRSSDNTTRIIGNTLSFGSSALSFGASQGASTGLGDLTFTDTVSRALGGGKTWTVTNATTVTFNNSWTGNTGHNITKAGSGTLVFNGNITSGNAIAVTVSAGTLALNGTNSAYTSPTTINGGTLSVAKLANINTNSSIGKGSVAGATADLVLNSGTLKYIGAGDSTNRPFTIGTGGGTIDASGTGAVTFNSTAAIALSGTDATRTLTLTGSNTGANTLSAILGNNGNGATSLTKSGSGTWILGGAQTYTGATNVSAGTLALSSGSSLASSSVSVASGATFNNNGIVSGSLTVDGTLSGSGTISGATTISGTLSPGNSPGILNFDGSLTLIGTTLLEIAGITRGTEYDGVNVGGTLTYGGILTVSTDSFALSAGQTYDLFDFSSLTPSSSFSTITVAGSALLETGVGTGIFRSANVDGMYYEFINATGDLSVSAIPEPSTYAAIAGALGLGVVLLRRRRRAQA